MMGIISELINEQEPLPFVLDDNGDVRADDPNMKHLGSIYCNLCLVNYGFFLNHEKLSILLKRAWFDRTGEKQWGIWQCDFPLGFIDWLLASINENELPLEQRPYKSICKPLECVENEYIYIMPANYRGNGGYFIKNVSRQERELGVAGKAMTLDLPNILLHDDGFLGYLKIIALKIKE